MNESGFSVSKWQVALHLEPGRIIVVHDDLDLPLAQLRVKAGGGFGGHRGIRSVIEAIGSADFLRVKVGIGRPRTGQDAAVHVLDPFDEREGEMIRGAVQRAADAVETLVQEGLEAAMNLSARPPRRIHRPARAASHRPPRYSRARRPTAPPP